MMRFFHVFRADRIHVVVQLVVVDVVVDAAEAFALQDRIDLAELVRVPILFGGRIFIVHFIF